MAEFATREDFPTCTLGQHVDLGGLTGIVVQIVRQSLKVMAQEGGMHSFNVVRLRRLHAPAPRPPAEVAPTAPEASDTAPVSPSKPVRPASASSSSPVRRRPRTQEPPPPPAPVIRRRFEGEPDFSAEIQQISAVACLPEFPESALGIHLDIAGYQGVLVEIVDQSIKVAAADGNVRRYNIQALRKLYGPGKAG